MTGRNWASLVIGSLNTVRARIIEHYLLSEVTRFCANKNVKMYEKAS